MMIGITDRDTVIFTEQKPLLAMLRSDPSWRYDAERDRYVYTAPVGEEGDAANDAWDGFLARLTTLTEDDAADLEVAEMFELDSDEMSEDGEFRFWRIVAV